MVDYIREVGGTIAVPTTANLLPRDTWGIFYPYDGLFQALDNREDALSDYEYAVREYGNGDVHGGSYLVAGAVLVRVSVHVEAQAAV